MIVEPIQDSHGDSTEVLRRLGKTNFQKEKIRPQSLAFCECVHSSTTSP